jgi:hypothetical protein
VRDGGSKESNLGERIEENRVNMKVKKKVE